MNTVDFTNILLNHGGGRQQEHLNGQPAQVKPAPENMVVTALRTPVRQERALPPRRKLQRRVFAEPVQKRPGAAVPGGDLFSHMR